MLSPIGQGSLRRRLIIILATALTPILIIAALQAYIDAKESLNLRRDALIQIADRAIDEVEQALTTSETLLVVFAEQIAAGRCDDVEGWLKPQIPALSNVVHFDRNGVAQCSSQGQPGYTLYDARWNDQLASGVKTLRTDAFYGKGLKAWMFAIFARLEINGEFVGSAAFGMRADHLAQMIDDAQLPEDVSIALSDDDLQIFGDEFGVDILPSWISDAAQSPGGHLFIAENDEGRSTDLIISRIGPTGVYAIVSRPSPGLLDELTLRPARTVGLPLLTFSIALLAAWLAIDKLVLRWLSRLKQLASSYGSGDYNAHPGQDFSEAPEEIAALANALDRMSTRIGERDAALNQALEVRDAAVKEIHHRVKNNLQIVTSFLNLQSRRVKDKEARNALAAARHRIDALSVVHQTLYQHEQLDTVHLKPFLEGLLQHLSNALGVEDQGVRLTYQISPVDRRADDAIPLALFIVEAITNSMKYAFDLDGGKIDLLLVEEPTQVKLTIRDDGQGAPLKKDSASAAQGGGLGSQLMSAFARQLNGEMTAQSQPGSGYLVTLIIPRT